MTKKKKKGKDDESQRLFWFCVVVSIIGIVAVWVVGNMLFTFGKIEGLNTCIRTMLENKLL